MKGDISERLNKLQELLPVSLVLKEMLQTRFNTLSFESLEFLKLRAFYDLFENRIVINFEADVEEYVKIIKQRHGIDIKPSEAWLWLFLHESGHASHKEKLQRIIELRERGEDLEAALLFQKCEEEAESYAKSKFLEWKSKHD